MLAVDMSPRRRRRRLPTFVLLTLVIALVGTGGLLIAARRTIDKVNRVPGLSGDLTAAPSGSVNYLMVGSDSRERGDPNTGITDVSGSRSDTIMILRHDRGSGSASLLSIPRDLYVEIPGYQSDRINAAFGHSPQVLVQTVQQSLKIPVHHYLEIDFSGFKQLVDAIGGVDLCFEVPTRDTHTGLNITEPGCHHLDGTAALAYARSRHYEEFANDKWREDPTADLGRTKRQQAFVNTALVTTLEVLKRNPMKAGELMSAIGASLSIDEDLDPMAAATSLRSAVQDGLTTDSLPVTGRSIRGKSVLQLGDGADVVLAYYRGDGPPPPRS